MVRNINVIWVVKKNASPAQPHRKTLWYSAAPTASAFPAPPSKCKNKEVSAITAFNAIDVAKSRRLTMNYINNSCNWSYQRRRRLQRSSRTYLINNFCIGRIEGVWIIALIVIYRGPVTGIHSIPSCTSAKPVTILSFVLNASSMAATKITRPMPSRRREKR
jgi:hypothetical protein